MVVAAGLMFALPALARTVITETFDDPATGWTNGQQQDVRVGYEAGEYWMTATTVSPIVLASNGFAFANGTMSVEVRNAGEIARTRPGVFLQAQDQTITTRSMSPQTAHSRPSTSSPARSSPTALRRRRCRPASTAPTCREI